MPAFFVSEYLKMTAGIPKTDGLFSKKESLFWGNGRGHLSKTNFELEKLSQSVSNVYSHLQKTVFTEIYFTLD